MCAEEHAVAVECSLRQKLIQKMAVSANTLCVEYSAVPDTVPENTREIGFLPRTADGIVDETAARAMAEALLERRGGIHTVKRKSGMRTTDNRFSWHDERAMGSVSHVQYDTGRSPLVHDAFEKHLGGYDMLDALLLLDTIRNGANMCFDGDRTVSVLPDNGPMSVEDQLRIEKELQSDIELGYLSGWHDAPPFPVFHTNPIYVIDKKEHGKRVGDRVIVNFSAPEGESINEQTKKLVCDYVRFEEAVELIVKHAGRDGWLGKIDVKSAFRQICIREADHHLQGIKWKGKYAFYTRMVWGERTSPTIWNRVGNALAFILKKHLHMPLTHYVDDFLPMYPSAVVRPDIEFGRFEGKCEELGVMMSANKRWPPAHEMTFTGVHFDLTKMVVSVTDDRRKATLENLQALLGQAKISLKKLESLLGRLLFIVKVMPPARVLLNRLITAKCRVHEGQRYVRLNTALRADLVMFARILSLWSGLSLLPTAAFYNDLEWVVFWTDSCESGMGGYWPAQQRYFAFVWPPGVLAMAKRLKKLSMPFLELYAVVVAVRLWSKHWSRMRVCPTSDCQPVVFLLKKWRSRNVDISSLLREMVHLQCALCFRIDAAVHVAGVDNRIADMLSRGQVEEAKTTYPDSLVYRDTVLPGMMPDC